MKKILLSLSIIGLSFAGLNAQTAAQTKPVPVVKGEKQTPEVRAKEEVAKLQTNLGLQANQVDKVNSLLVSYYTKKDDLKGKKSGMDMQKFEEKMKSLRDDLNAGLKGVLTAEQMKTLSASRSDKK